MIADETSLSWPAVQEHFGGRKLVYVRIVVAAIFDFMTEEDWGE